MRHETFLSKSSRIVMSASCVLLCLGWGSGDVSLYAKDWYVSNEGKPDAAGSEQDPLSIVGTALSRSGSGDRIFLMRGSVFREGGLGLSDDRTILPYGDVSYPAPVLSGSRVVTGFSPWSGDNRIYTAQVNPGESGVTQVFVNGEFATLARYPNSGWLRTQEGSGDNLIVQTGLGSVPGASSGYWVGAQVRWRKWSWWYETRPITADNGSGRLSLGGQTAISGLTGIDSGFFIDNTLKALDAPGEWYWNSASGTLYIYPPAGADPASMTVEVVWRPVGLSIDTGTLQGITVQHYVETGVEVNRLATVTDCDIRHIGDKGIFGTWNCAGSHITGNRIEDVLNLGISWVQNPEHTTRTIIEHNTLNRIGNRNGLGGSGTWHAAGIIISVANENGNGVIVRYNRIRETGYAGIILGPDGQTVERNVFRNCMNTLNDGGAIYANCSRSIIRENIILDTVGDMESAQPFFPLGHGIWPEFLEDFHHTVIEGNTVYGSGGNGIFLPNNFDCTIRDNVLLSNRSAGLCLEAADNSSRGQNHSIQGNLMGIGARPWQSDRPENLATWALPNDSCLSYDYSDGVNMDFGSMAGSTFVTGDGLDLVINQEGNSQTIANWQSAESDWADPSPAVWQGSAFLFINDSEATVSFPLPGGVTWRRVDGALAGSAVSIPTFRSVVLFAADGSYANLPGYFLFSELSANQPPELNPVGSRTVEAGQPLTISVSASDADEDGLSFSATGSGD